MAIKIGDKAPLFTLKNTDNKEISLSDYQNNRNVLVLFFPLAFTGVCTTELCSTRDNMKLYESLNAEVLAISVDSMFSLNAFKQAQNYNFNLLSDFNKETAQAYGILYEDFMGMKGVAKRSAFVIDKEGTIQYSEVLEQASDLPDFDSIQSVLAGLN